MQHYDRTPLTSVSSEELKLPAVLSRTIESAKALPEGCCHQDLLEKSLSDLFIQYKALWSAEYEATVSEVANQLGVFEGEKLASICIPVAGAQEMEKIYRCIQSLAYQTLPTKKFEIALLVNFSDRDEREGATNIETLNSEIARAKRDFPHLDVRTATFEFDSAALMTIGYLRSLLCDAVMRRAHDNVSLDDMIMLRLDADTRATKQQLLESHIRLYHSRPNVLSIQGGLLWSPEGLEKNPPLFAQLAYDSLQSMVNRHRRVLSDWSGPSASIRGSAYCWIGGYDPRDLIAEDRQLAVRLLKALPRESCLEGVTCGGPSTIVITSNRRAAAAFCNEIPVSLQWSNPRTQFSCDDRAIRVAVEGYREGAESRLLLSKAPDSDDQLTHGATLAQQAVVGLNMDFERSAQLLSIPGVLSRLHRAYAVEETLTQRMLQKLPDGVTAQRGEIPDHIRRIEASDAPRPRHSRFLFHSLDWTKDLSLSIRRSLGRYKMDSSQITIVVESPTPHEKSIRIDLNRDLVMRLWLKQEPESTPILKCAIDRKHWPAETFSVGAKLIHDAISAAIVKRCLPYTDIFYAEPTRLVADRIVEIIARSLIRLCEEKSEAYEGFKTVGKSGGAFGLPQGL